MRNARICKYFANYFPVKLIKTADIDAGKGNYLFGSHPHGVLCSGMYIINSEYFYTMNIGYENLN